MPLVSFADWAAPPVHVLKQDGNIQISSDISVTINQASKLDQYPLHELKVCFLLCLEEGLSPSWIRVKLTNNSYWMRTLNCTMS